MGLDVCKGIKPYSGFIWVEDGDDFKRINTEGWIIDYGSSKAFISSEIKYIQSLKPHSININPWKEYRKNHVFYIKHIPFDIITPKLEIRKSSDIGIIKVSMIKDNRRFDFLLKDSKILVGSRMLPMTANFSSMEMLVSSDIDYVVKDMSKDGDFYVYAYEMYKKKLIGTFGIMLLSSIENNINNIKSLWE